MDRLTKILAIIILLILIIWTFYPAQDNVDQPIAYSHKIHIEEVGAECVDCHIYVKKMASATIPTIQICKQCHGDEPMSDSPEEKKLLRYIEENREIPWKRIYKVPDHVYFSHRRHVVLGELECSECHGNVSEFTTPVPYPFLPVTMNNCMDCHKKHKVSNDCLNCHR